jgi:hypothetical protein
MFQFELEHVISEIPNVIPRTWDFWILVTYYLLERGAHFYKPKFKERVKEGGRVIRVEFVSHEVELLCWKLCWIITKKLEWIYA